MSRRRLVNQVKICLYCKQEFHPFNSVQKFCSYKCLYDYRYEIKREADCTKPKKCLYCGEEFKPSNYRGKYCGRGCFIKDATKKPKKKVCPICKVSFNPIRMKQIYCSRQCSGEGKKASRPQVAFNKKGRKARRVYLDNLWSRAVKLQAGNQCEYCGKTSSLNSHHIFSRSNYHMRWEIENGSCLCASHHILSTFSAHKAPLEFAEFFKEKRGGVWYQSLLEEARQIKKFTIPELEELEASLREKIQILEGK